MSTTSRRLALATAAVAVAAASPAQAVTDTMPGLSDAAQGNATTERTYRSPEGAAPHSDLRGEAARSAADPRSPVVVELGPVSGEGLDWTAVGLGAGGSVALAAMSAGGLLVIRRTRTSRLAG